MGTGGTQSQSDTLRAAAWTPDADTLTAARNAFDRAHPQRSARRVLFFTQFLALAALVAGVVYAFRAAPSLSVAIGETVLFGLFLILILWRLVAAASLAPISRTLYPAESQHWPTYTLLCPLYRKSAVVADLVASLERLDYPQRALQILLLVEADDIDTMTAALAAAGAPHIEVVLVPASIPRTKPKALNVGLARARGEFIGVYDAEDRPHPKQLRAALAAFAREHDQLAAVQAPLVIDNAAHSWIARQFAAEYAIQFREILPLLSRLGLPLPLGGSSNHFRTEALRAVGGWDAYNVTEDADLGYRFAREGQRVGVIAPPTFEEAPITLPAWLNQRTRWIKGHLQTWLVLMRNPIRSAREMGLRPFLAMHLVLGGGLAAAFAHGPLAIIVFVAAVTPFDLLGAPAFSLALSGYAVAVFGALSAVALSGEVSHARAAVTMPLYWPLSSIAAYRAVFELFFRPHYWAKTAHGLSPRERPPREAPALIRVVAAPAQQNVA